MRRALAGAVGFVVVALRFGAWRFDVRRRERLAIAREVDRLASSYSRAGEHRTELALESVASWLRAAAGEVER